MNPTVALLRAMATGSIYKDRKHDIILNAAADEIERLRAINAELKADIGRLTVEANAVRNQWQSTLDINAELLAALDVLLDEALNFSVSGVYFDEPCMGHKGPALARAAIAKAKGE